ncbi:MAG: S41 family peptidase [Defluviitaleaceae bacterium]|nr:S41 family peptidase [Defluviitaleaceae bacterium]
MKKYKSILITTAFVALFAAALIFLPAILISRIDPRMSQTATSVQPVELDFTSLMPTPPRPQWQPPQLTREQFLEDFDYLMTALEENFPSFGIIYRRNGVDMMALVPELRQRILDAPETFSYISFWNMLRDDFFSHAFPVGHLWLACYYGYFQSSYQRFNNRRRTVYSYFGDRLTSHIWSEEHLYHSQRVTPTLGFNNHRITTEILTEGQVAYIRLPRIHTYSLSRTPIPADIRRVDAFYSQLEGFEHLILDMRGIYGGLFELFTRPLITPLIDYPLETTFHQFYMAGENNKQQLSRGAVRTNTAMPFNISDLPTIFPHANMSEAVISDLRLMDYYIARNISVAPHPERRAPFNGKVWLLTDMNNFSAAQQIAAFLHQTGFATLVGQTTGGMAAYITAVHSRITLPNTTFQVRYDPLYIISADGRPWEYGTVPHHFNRDGMDALQTVLALIAEGE